MAESELPVAEPSGVYIVSARHVNGELVTIYGQTDPAKVNETVQDLVDLFSRAEEFEFDWASKTYQCQTSFTPTEVNPPIEEEPPTDGEPEAPPEGV